MIAYAVLVSFTCLVCIFAALGSLLPNQGQPTSGPVVFAITLGALAVVAAVDAARVSIVDAIERSRESIERSPAATADAIRAAAAKRRDGEYAGR